MKPFVYLISCLCLVCLSGTVLAKPGGVPPYGLNPQAEQELRDAQVDKYVGDFHPAFSEDVGQGWTKHTFDPGLAFDGPLCVAGTPYSVFTRQGNPAKLLIMLQGGGACWQGFYNCNIRSEDQEPPPPAQVGIWDEQSGLNPIDDWSVVYMPYCDGSVFSGDNDVVDFGWQAYIEGELGLPPGTGPFVRFHRGLRNVTAGIDLARKMFPHAGRVVVAGSSAGGVGASAFAPFLARMAYGNTKKLMVFNDAGPVAINLADTGAIAARAADWNFGQFYPASCSDCDEYGQGTELIKWRLANDSTIREAFYSTDFDLTNRFFMGLLPTVGPEDPQYPLQFLLTGLLYRNLIIGEHSAIHALFPERYKTFIRAARFSHTALQTLDFYESADGVPLYEWLGDFIVPRPSWINIVEELPAP
ncbi:MAG TPA: pectin acetylesterase-family hydrolase [Woeseiaceae bacterium]|nr:pectin acetylesterase-family hydrolase [Woeseiaceae bacterium]